MNDIGIAYNITYVLYLLVMLSNREHTFTFGVTIKLIIIGFSEHHTTYNMLQTGFWSQLGNHVKITNLHLGQLTNQPTIE